LEGLPACLAACLSCPGVKHFGGAYLKKSNPKKARPISTKRSMHLVLRSSRATGGRSLLRKSRQIFEIVYAQAKLHGVKIYRYANAGNHLHLVIMPRSVVAFKKFVRATSGLIARLILGVERGRARFPKSIQPKNPKSINQLPVDHRKAEASSFLSKTSPSLKTSRAYIKFWDQRPFTRIVEWGRDFKNACSYLMQNTLEAIGFLEYKTRVRKYQRLNSTS
jgi:hypothetical protein